MNKKETIDFTMGADPEFICVNSRGWVIRAEDVVSTSETVISVVMVMV